MLEPGKRTLHTLLPGMLFRAGETRPWIVAGSMGGDAQPQIHAQFVSAVVDGGVDVRTAVAAPRWYVEPADHFEPPVEVRLEPRHAASIAPALEALGHPVTLVGAVRQRPGPRARDRAGGRRTGRRRRLASRPPRTLAARACRPSTRASRQGFCRGPVICDTPAAGGRLRSHEAATGVVIRATGEAFVTSNVSQNYPYSSESEADRAAVIARLLADREGLAATLDGRGVAGGCAGPLVGLEVPDEGLPGPAPRGRLRDREARRVRRLRRDLRQDLPALSGSSPMDGPDPGRGPATSDAPERIDRRPLVSDAVGITVSIVGFAFVYGLSAREAGFTPLDALAMSSIAFAGAAQFAAVGYVAGGLPFAGIILLTGLLNARHLLYSAALRPWMRDVPVTRRAVMAHFLTDENFALVMAHFRRIGRTDERAYWMSALLFTFIPWNLATLAGVHAGRRDPGPVAVRHRRHLPGGDDRDGGRAHHRSPGARGGRRGGRDRRARSPWPSAPRSGSSPAACSGRRSGSIVPAKAAHEVAPIGTRRPPNGSRSRSSR